MKDFNLSIYNTLSRKKEKYEPIIPGHTGLYVCGPTVYGDAHLGQARPAITFDLLYRYLKHSGFKVRYVRNITDVGLSVNDADDGEDKIAKKARLEELEPMQVVQYYTNRYHKNMEQLNVLNPDIEPHASGHIIEQIEMVKQILDAGLAYEVNGSVYFDVKKYNEKHHYGKLSGRVLEDLINTTRTLDGQEEKRNPVDFALWKKAGKEHIMRWPSPWSDGFPGWHLECSVMSTKYLGEKFDIHGGGMDLMFPHHECEIAQNVAATGNEPVKYWMHNNMITINGQKMGKSLGNFINLDEFFKGEHKLLDRPYTAMNIRFFILMAHYRSPLDFSNEALQAAEKGMKKLLNAAESLEKLQANGDASTEDITAWKNKCYEAINDDLNTPILIAHLFDAVRMINSISEGKIKISKSDLELLRNTFNAFVFDVLGLEKELSDSKGDQVVDGLMELILEMRMNARKNKDWGTSDAIRDKLNELSIKVKDGKEGSSWSIE